MVYDWQTYEAEMSAFDARMRAKLGEGAIGHFGGYAVVEARHLLAFHEVRVFAQDRVVFVGELAHFEYRMKNMLALQRLRDEYAAKVRQLCKQLGVDASLTTE